MPTNGTQDELSFVPKSRTDCRTDTTESFDEQQPPPEKPKTEFKFNNPEVKVEEKNKLELKEIKMNTPEVYRENSKNYRCELEESSSSLSLDLVTKSDVKGVVLKFEKSDPTLERSIMTDRIKVVKTTKSRLSMRRKTTKSTYKNMEYSKMSKSKSYLGGLSARSQRRLKTTRSESKFQPKTRAHVLCFDLQEPDDDLSSISLVQKILNLQPAKVIHDELTMDRTGFYFVREAISYTTRSYVYRAKGLTTVPVVCKVSILDRGKNHMDSHFLNAIRIVRYLGGNGQEPQHLAFIRVYDVFRIENKLYTFMNEVNSESLLDLIKKKKDYSQEEGRSWMRQVCEAVKFIQKRRIAHRLIKIDHVLFDFTKHIKLCSWANAALYWNDRGELVKQPPERKCFANSHLPPEAFEGKYDPSIADNWSLGVLLGAIHTRRYLFNAQSRVDFATQWKNFNRKHHINVTVLTLLNNIFSVTMENRLTVDQMLNHVYFSTVDIRLPKRGTRSVMSSLCRGSKISSSHLEVSRDRSLSISSSDLKNQID